MKVLIAGCGYIGIRLGAELTRQGHTVYGLRRTRISEEALTAAGIRPVQGDLTRAADLERLPSPLDWVVNTVSSSKGGLDDYRHVYLEGMRVLVAWLRRHPPRKFVYTSSTGVYGQEDGSLVDEDSATQPATATGQVLVDTEQVVRAAVREFNLPAVILRAAGIYGPGRGYWFKRFLNDPVVLPEQGWRISNMIHCEDLVGCLIAALEHGQPGAIYNAVDDEPVTVLDFFRWLSAALDRPMPDISAAAPAGPRKRGGTNKRVSNRKLKAELHYTFRYPTFREGYAAEVARLKSATAGAQ